MKAAFRRTFALSSVLLLLLFSPEAEGAELSVAVQPFLSQGTEFYLGPAVSEIVSTSLAGARDITVVERMRLAEVARQHRSCPVVDTATAAKAEALRCQVFILAVSHSAPFGHGTAGGRGVRQAPEPNVIQAGRDEIVLVSRNLSAELGLFSGDARRRAIL